MRTSSSHRLIKEPKPKVYRKGSVHKRFSRKLLYGLSPPSDHVLHAPTNDGTTLRINWINSYKVIFAGSYLYYAGFVIFKLE